MTALTQQDREMLRIILRNVDDAQLAAHNSARTFRTLLVIVAFGLAVGAVVFPSIAGRADPSVLRLTAAPTPVATAAPSNPTAPTSATPSGSALTGSGTGQSNPDTTPAYSTAAAAPTLRTLATVELWGMVGGLIGALATVLRIRGSTTPIGLQLAQFAIKLPAGAWTGMVGVILLQSTLLPSVQPAPTYTLAAYAIVFGAGQQALTRFVDQRASALLDKTKTQGESTVQTG